MQKLAILVTRLSSWVLSKMGRGGSMPGRLGIKIAPDCLNHLKFGGPVILVTGTNGKTSTANMVSDLMEEAGYKVGSDVAFAMDAAASELYSEEDGMYHFPGEAQTHAEVDVNLRRPDTQGGAYTSEAHVKTQEITEKKEVLRSAQEMISLYEELTTEYPLISIEDGLDEDDWEGWQELTKRMKEQVMLVGDDLFVTNVKRIRCGMDLKVANAVLIKVNQIGTLTEAMDAIELAQKNGYKAIISHRSGETEDSFIADLAVAVNAGWIKTGAPCRGERTAKYNQLLRISETL